MRRLRGLWWNLIWLWRGGVTLDAIPDAQVRPLVSQPCYHPVGCWSYCTGSYRYCLCCGQVRVRC